MKDSNLAQGHLLMNEVDVDLNVLHVTMMDGVSHHIDGTDTVPRRLALRRPNRRRRRSSAAPGPLFYGRRPLEAPESASRPLVCFGGLIDTTIKGLTIFWVYEQELIITIVIYVMKWIKIQDTCSYDKMNDMF